MALLLVFENDLECAPQMLGPKRFGQSLLPADV
jgi:hypothetical protein